MFIAELKKKTAEEAESHLSAFYMEITVMMVVKGALISNISSMHMSMW